MNPATTSASLLLVLLAAGCAAWPAPQAGLPPTGEKISVYLGQRSLDSSDWAPVEDQPTLGVEYANEMPGHLVGWEVGIMGSADSGDIGGIGIDASTAEVYGGVHKSFDTGTLLRPYVGGGLAYITGDFEALGVSDSDGSPAGYVHGGLALEVSQAFFVGVDARFLFGTDISLFGFGADLDYTQLALVLGWTF